MASLMAGASNIKLMPSLRLDGGRIVSRLEIVLLFLKRNGQRIR